MPTYDYKCDACGDRFERFQKMSDGPVTECPACGGRVRRLISFSGGIIMHGSGTGKKECGCDRSDQCGGMPGSCGGAASCGGSCDCH
jgi:putative FmdB family regulatory protein